MTGGPESATAHREEIAPANVQCRAQHQLHPAEEQREPIACERELREMRRQFIRLKLKLEVVLEQAPFAVLGVCRPGVACLRP